MRLLLDTHLAFWAMFDAGRLPIRARDRMLDPDNQVWASTASIWEFAIKHRKRQQDARDAVVPGSVLHAALLAAGIGVLPITPEHAAAVDGLPDVHRDPFDRLLVAQAISEPMRLLTVDAILAGYGDHVLIV